MCDKDMFNEMEEGDSLGISSLLLMENPPVHLIISRPIEAENKGEYSKALRLYEELEALIDERLQGTTADRAMMEKEEVKQIASQEKLLNTAILALDSVLEGTTEIRDNFVLYLNQHFKRQKTMMLRKTREGSDNSNETTKEMSCDNFNLENSEVVKRVKYGIVRNLLRLWRIDEGLQLMNNIYHIEDPEFFVECGDIIMEHRNFETAGNLYERGGNIVKSVEAFLLAKDLNRAKLVLEDNPTPEGWKIIAQTKEIEGDFEEAAKYYGICGDIDAAVKIYLQLKLPEEALLLVKKYRGASAASVESVAEFLLKNGEGNKETALELLISLGRVKEATSIAEKYNLQKDLVEKVYRTYVMEKRSEIPQEFDTPLNEAIIGMMSIGKRSGSDVELDCGTSFALLGKYEVAYPLLLKVIQDSVGKPECSQKENKAWAFLKLIATNIKDKSVKERIVNVMEGGVEGISKNSTHLCDYFVIEKRWLDAAKVKKSLSEGFLKNGEVKPAYASIVEGMRFLFRRDSGNINVQDMSRDLVDYLDYFHILHSFRLMTMHTSLKSFRTAAFLAYRLRTSIDRFPKSVQALILSSGAMYAHMTQCGVVGKELAVLLMKDKELVSHVPAKHKSAIENIVRKKPAPCGVEKTSCPRCRAYVDVWMLQCPNCAMLMSMCVISGKHLSAGDITSCKVCHFPMNQSELENFVKLGLQVCPICKDQMVALHDPAMFPANGSSFICTEEEFSEECDEKMLTHRPSITNFKCENPHEFYCDAAEDERRMEMAMKAQTVGTGIARINTALMSSRSPSGAHSFRIRSTFVPQCPSSRKNQYEHFTARNFDYEEDY